MENNCFSENVSLVNRTYQNNILLELIKELCSDPRSSLSTVLKDKVNKIIVDCDLVQYSSLHSLSTSNESTASLLGIVREVVNELTFEEQEDLNLAVLQKIQQKIPYLTSELNNLKRSIGDGTNKRKQHKRELQEQVDNKLNILKDQEKEKVDLMVEWLNHRLYNVSKFSSDTTELLTLKTRILELKSRILHLQILRNIYTETNQSIKSYSEIHKDLKDSIRETEKRILEFKNIIESDYN